MALRILWILVPQKVPALGVIATYAARILDMDYEALTSRELQSSCACLHFFEVLSYLFVRKCALQLVTKS